MLTADKDILATRRTLRNVKSNGKENAIPRRKSLGANTVLNDKEKGISALASIPRKIYKNVRRSLAPNDILSPKPMTKQAADMDFPRMDLAQKTAEKLREAAAEQAENIRNAKLGLNKPFMQFSLDDHLVLEYYKINDNRNMDMASIGGMIKLHQYCYMEHKQSKWPVHRDAANFFRDADIGCILNDNQIPIRMVYYGLYDCKDVEVWYRDYYSRRDLDRFNVLQEYTEDKYTSFDKFFDEVGRDAYSMMIQQMHVMENYCAQKFQNTNLEDYHFGVTFWRNASPFHMPRNYKLALLLTKKNGWNLEIVENWFRMFYNCKSWCGARAKDVYIKEDEDNSTIV